MSKNKDLQKLLTSFEEEVGHIKEWQLDASSRMQSLNNDRTSEDRKQSWKKIKPSKMYLKSLTKSCYTIKEISKKCGHTVTTVRGLLKDYGLYDDFKLKDKPDNWSKKFASYGGKKTNKPIAMFYYDSDKTDGKGEFIKNYNSIKEAVNETGLSAIGKVVNKQQKRCGKSKGFQGYYFEFVKTSN